MARPCSRAAYEFSKKASSFPQTPCTHSAHLTARLLALSSPATRVKIWQRVWRRPHRTTPLPAPPPHTTTHPLRPRHAPPEGVHEVAQRRFVLVSAVRTHLRRQSPHSFPESSCIDEARVLRRRTIPSSPRSPCAARPPRATLLAPPLPCHTHRALVARVAGERVSAAPSPAAPQPCCPSRALTDGVRPAVTSSKCTKCL